MKEVLRSAIRKEMNSLREQWNKLPAVDLCRELYDRFVVGGWELQDAHVMVVAMLNAASVPVSPTVPENIPPRLPQRGIFLLLFPLVSPRVPDMPC
jgi:hypothetical protein